MTIKGFKIIMLYQKPTELFVDLLNAKEMSTFRHDSDYPTTEG